VGELGAAIITLGGVGQDLDDQDRIQQGVDRLILEAGLATGGGEVGVGIHAGFTDLDAHVVGIDFTRFSAELAVNRCKEVPTQQIVPPTGARHGEDVTVEVFVTGFLLAFPSEVVLGGEEKFGSRAHGVESMGG